MSIIVKNLTKSYGPQKAIDNISFTANSNEILGLIGPNGAGKTTTMKILTCFMAPSTGEAEIFGLNINSDQEEIKKIIGYLAEHNPLYDNMYVKEYLLFVSKIHKIPNAESRMKEVIDLVGLGKEQHKKINELSKGYKQRVGIAQAIIHKPKVLILDEPISGLDPNQLIEIRSLVRELRKDTCIIFSSHILQEIESICDRIVILSKGKIITNDSLEKLSKELQDDIFISLELLNPVRPEELESINGIRNVEVVNDNTFVIKINNDKSVRSEIFDFIVKNNNKILEMSVRHDSLENIFKSMTQSDA